MPDQPKSNQLWRPFLSDPSESERKDRKGHVPPHLDSSYGKEHVASTNSWAALSDTYYTDMLKGQFLNHWYTCQNMVPVSQCFFPRGCPGYPTLGMVAPLYYLKSYAQAGILKPGNFYPFRMKNEDATKLYSTSLGYPRVTEPLMTTNIRHLLNSGHCQKDYCTSGTSESSIPKEERETQENDSHNSLKADETDCEVIVVDDDSTCRYCHKKLTNVGSQHEKRCKVKTEGKYRCSKCGKTYSQSHTLKQHMYSHAGYKPYGCRSCSKRFADVSTRNKHERIHTGETPYLCPKCNRGFTQSGNMYRHMAKIHGEAETFHYRAAKRQRQCVLRKRV